MAATPILWALSALCAGLLVALAVTLQKLYRIRNEETALPAGGRIPQGWDKLDELLSMLLTLQEHGISHSGSVSREDFCSAVLDCACRLMNSNRGSMMLWSEKDQALKIIATKGQVSRSLVLKPNEGVAGRAFSTGQAIYISDPKADPRMAPTSAPPQEPADPFLSLPLPVKSRPIGVMTLHATPATEPFNDYNIKFLNILAGEAAVMLNNLDLMDELQTFYLEMVQTLARAVDTKDAYTHEHSDRARMKARKVAEALELPDQMARYVEYAALLHDIGKIGIDEAILLKPGKLTPEEYEVMKKHPSIGHKILAPVKFLGPVAQMVLHHQEWYNGQGYPEALKGDEIPLGARIVAVIDAWDAMTSDRPYRKALGRVVAIGELKKGAGTQFDPKIVDVFLKLEEKEWAGEKTPGGHPHNSDAHHRANPDRKS